MKFADGPAWGASDARSYSWRSVMGIFDALTTAVAGLQAQSFALQNISGNVANSQTTGYKEKNASFADLVSQAVPSQQTANGVVASSRGTNTVQGSIQSTSVSTDMAINGDGFFVVAKPTGFTDNQPVFSGISDYTRAGDFELNANGNLVNGAGYYLMGIPVDAATGNPVGNVPTVLQFNNNFVPAQATTQIQYAANLPTVPVTTASPNATPKTITAAGGLNQVDFGANNPVVAGTPAQPFTSASVTGNAAVNNSSPATAITSGTLLSNLSTPVTSGDTITVDGAVINFTNGSVVTPPTETGGTLTGGVDIATAAISDASALNFNVNGTAVTLAAGTGTGPGATFSATDIKNAINGTAGINVTASVNAGGDIVLTQNTPSTTAITVGGANATTVFGSSPATAAPSISLNPGNTIGDLLKAVDLATGNTGAGSTPSSVASGQVTLNSGINNDLKVTGDTGGTFAALGFTTGGLPAATRTGGGQAGTGFVIGSDVTTFDNESISGGAITVYNSAGTPVNVQLRWAMTDSSTLGVGHSNTWNLFYQSDPSATGSAVAWTNVGQNFTFNANGNLVSPAGGSVTIPNLTVAGQNVGNINFNFASGALTQFASSGGNATG